MTICRQLGNPLNPHGVSGRSHFPAANTAAVITLAALVDQRWVVYAIQYSYSGTPTGGKLTMTKAAITTFEVDILAGGPGFFDIFVNAEGNQEVVITLAAGGVGITGKLNAQVSLETGG